MSGPFTSGFSPIIPSHQTYAAASSPSLAASSSTSAAASTTSSPSTPLPSTTGLPGQESHYQQGASAAASTTWAAVDPGVFGSPPPSAPRVSNAELQQALGGIAAALKATMNDLPPGMGVEKIMEQLEQLEAKLTELVGPAPPESPAESAETAETAAAEPEVSGPAEAPAPADTAAETETEATAETSASEEAAAESAAAETDETEASPETQESLTQEQNQALNTQPPVLAAQPDLKEQYDSLLEMLRDKRIQALLNHLDGLPVMHRIQDMLESQQR